ncbi:MAG TPA: acyltransferase [Gemmataceae bacterium]|jgi:acetyltransferase-like isoleucine patch superfamily enzyme|nr:acyltransferase [Gemmataceae bacterium]
MKSFLKTCANFAALLMVLPAYFFYRLGGLAIGPDKVFPGWSQLFSLLPGLTGVTLRRAFYRLVLPQCEADCCISFGTTFSHPTARIGRAVYVGLYCSIGDVTLEDDVLISSNVSILNGGNQHGIARLDIPVREQPGVYTHVTIGRDSWIGDRAIVMADVGRHCVVGAASLVTKPVPDFAVVVGAPARIVGSRKPTESGERIPQPSVGAN